MKTSKFILSVLLVVIMLAYPTSLARAFPPLPATFYGLAQVAGENVPVGTPVTAWINGVKYATSYTYLVGEDTYFTLDIPGDDSDTSGVIEGGTTGQAITFKIVGIAATPSLPNPTWQVGGFTRLDLSIPNIHVVFLPLITR